MSTFTCPHCGKGTDVFRRGGGERISRELGLPFLGTIPLDPDIVESGDEGRPIVLEKPNSVAAMAYLAIAKELAGRLQGLQTTGLKPFAWTWDTGEGEPTWLESAIRPSGSRTTAIGFRRRDARTLSVLWEDGQRNDFDVRDLRLACRCAQCVEEMSGRPLLDPKSVRPDVTPRTITSVGNYAIQVNWSDGHSTGFTHSSPCGPSRSTAQPGSWKMSEVLPFDPTITIRAEPSQADPDTCTFTVSRMVHPGGPFFFDSKDRASGSPLVERLFALPGVSHVLVAETVGDGWKGPECRVVGAEIGSRRGHPDAATHRCARDLRGSSQRRRAGSDRRRDSCVRSGTPGPRSESFHRKPWREDLNHRRPGRQPLHCHERRLPGLRCLFRNLVTGVRGHGAQGGTGDCRHRGHDGPRGRRETLLPAHDLGDCRWRSSSRRP